MPETTPLIKAALNLRVGVGFDVYYNIKGILLTKRKCKKILKEYLVTLRREDIALEQMTNKEIVAMYKYICSVAESVNYFVQIS